jgi:hypothetical protein
MTYFATSLLNFTFVTFITIITPFTLFTPFTPFYLKNQQSS